MAIHLGNRHRYTWIEDWGQYPDTDQRRNGWAHPGMAVTPEGLIVTVHPGEAHVLFFEANGTLVKSLSPGLIEVHGIAVAQERNGTFLWLADNGAKRQRGSKGVTQTGGAGGKVVKMTLQGDIALTLETPPTPAYASGVYSPTGVVVDDEASGGSGDIWVADGYGQSYVHRYSQFRPDGSYVQSIDGTEGGPVRFACPHGIAIDRRGREPQLLIADRTNKRIQVYDLEGTFKRSFGTDYLSSPSAFAFDGTVLIVGELRARLALIDEHDQLIEYLGANDAVCTEPGWPNMLDEEGNPARTNRLRPGTFNSPHGLCADQEGNIYVAEWLIGGRMIKLVKERPAGS